MPIMQATSCPISLCTTSTEADQADSIVEECRPTLGASDYLPLNQRLNVIQRAGDLTMNDVMTF